MIPAVTMAQVTPAVTRRPGGWWAFTDWSTLARCPEPTCDASPGWPCYDPFPVIVDDRLWHATVRTHPHRRRRQADSIDT